MMSSASRWIVPVSLLLASGAGIAPGMQAPGSNDRSASAPAISKAKPVQTATAIPQLVDITASTGIRFDHLSAPENKYIVESMSGGVAIIDYDRDGWPDLYFTNAPDVAMQMRGETARSALYHNNHDGTFTDVTDKAGVGHPCWAMGAVVGDYNNDGWPDLLVTCLNGVVLYRNNGNGTFTNVTKQAGLGGVHGWTTGAAFGDYNGDGWPDIFISRYVDLNLHDLPAFGSTRNCQYLGVQVQCGPRGLKGSSDYLFRNNGNGTFTDVSEAAGVSNPQHLFGLTAVWSDFNHDGLLDLFVANDGAQNYLYRNNGHGHFTDVAYQAGVAVNQDGNAQANMGVALGDYEHTGRFAIAITHFSEEYTELYRNDGNMNFTDAAFSSGIARATTHYVGWGDAFLDVNNDGWPDFIMVNGHVYPQVDQAHVGIHYREPKLLFLNEKNGTFRNVSSLAGPALQIPQVSRGLAVGDLFNDGHLEVVVENLVGQPMILRPEGKPRNRWISFELEGTKCNRLALNARMRVTAGDLVQTDEVRSGGSYLSQSDLRLHFGLGSHTGVTKAVVFWPQGGAEAVTNLPADHLYCIRQGSGVVPCTSIRPVRPAVP